MAKLYATVTIECGKNDPDDPRLRSIITSEIEWAIEKETGWNLYQLVCSDVTLSKEPVEKDEQERH